MLEFHLEKGFLCLKIKESIFQALCCAAAQYPDPQQPERVVLAV